MATNKTFNRRNVKELTPKQQLFIREYIVDLNATRAAIRAGYSEKTANEQGNRLLANVSIQKAIKNELEKKLNKLDILSDKVINELKKIGFADINDFLSFNENGVVLNNSDNVDGTMINEVTSVTTENTIKNGTNTRTQLKFKLHDKLKALEMLGRYLNLWKTDKEEDSVEKTINNIKTIVVQIVKTPEQIEAEKRGRMIEGG